MKNAITKTIHEDSRNFFNVLFLPVYKTFFFLLKWSFFDPSGIRDLISPNAWNESNSSWLRTKNDKNTSEDMHCQFGLYAQDAPLTNLSNYWIV